MVNSYDEMMGDEQDPRDHPAYNKPDATQHYAGDVVPIRPSFLERDIAGARRQVENERSMRNISNQGSSGVDPANIRVFPTK